MVKIMQIEKKFLSNKNKDPAPGWVRVLGSFNRDLLPDKGELLCVIGEDEYEVTLVTGNIQKEFNAWKKKFVLRFEENEIAPCGRVYSSRKSRSVDWWSTDRAYYGDVKRIPDLRLDEFDHWVAARVVSIKPVKSWFEARYNHNSHELLLKTVKVVDVVHVPNQGGYTVTEDVWTSFEVPEHLRRKDQDGRSWSYTR